MKDINTLFDKKQETQSCELDQTKNTIFDEIYTKCLQPNAAEFRENYRKNCYMLNTVEYDACTLDFIPVADKEYIMLDRENRSFCGTFTAEPYQNDSNIEKSFFSILIADEWDIRKMMPVIWEKQWRQIYFVLNRETKKFASFFKLKDFPAMLPPNVKFFASTEEMRQYFLEDHNIYLPRRVFAADPGKYEALLDEIHNTRIQSGVPSDNVFLSICIPSYDRGSRALETVQHILETKYDAEIEVVLSNNGSVLQKEDYQKIRDLKDSRVRYYEFEKNEGYGASYCNALSRARGHFGFMLSDEDPLIIENVDKVLECLFENNGIGVFTFSAGNDNKPQHARPNVEKLMGAEAAKRIHESMIYFSGWCYNMDLIKSEKVFDVASIGNGSAYFDYYIQFGLGTLLTAKHVFYNTGIIAFDLGKREEHGGLRYMMADDGILEAARLESRLNQLETAMDIAGCVLSADDLGDFFFYWTNAIFGKYADLFKYCGAQRADSKIPWLNTWKNFYQSYLNILKKTGLENDDALIKKMEEKIFFKWITCKHYQNIRTPEENLLPSLQAQVVKYYYDKGTPIEDIDFDQIEKDLEGWVQDFLAKKK